MASGQCGDLNLLDNFVLFLMERVSLVGIELEQNAILQINFLNFGDGQHWARHNFSSLL